MSNSEMPPVKHGQSQDDIMNLETLKNHKTLEKDHSDDKASDKANSAKHNGSGNINIGLGIFFIIGAIIVFFIVQYGCRRNERIASDGEQGDKQQGSSRKYMRAIPVVLIALGLYFLLGPESGKEFLSAFGVPLANIFF